MKNNFSSRKQNLYGEIIAREKTIGDVLVLLSTFINSLYLVILYHTKGTGLATHRLWRLAAARFIGFPLSDSRLCQTIKILQKFFFDWAIIGGGTIFPRSPKDYTEQKKI